MFNELFCNVTCKHASGGFAVQKGLIKHALNVGQYIRVGFDSIDRPTV